jgi:hypothetical protein
MITNDRFRLNISSSQAQVGKIDRVENNDLFEPKYQPNFDLNKNSKNLIVNTEPY